MINISLFDKDGFIKFPRLTLFGVVFKPRRILIPVLGPGHEAVQYFCVLIVGPANR